MCDCMEAWCPSCMGTIPEGAVEPRLSDETNYPIYVITITTWELAKAEAMRDTLEEMLSDDFTLEMETKTTKAIQVRPHPP